MIDPEWAEFPQQHKRPGMTQFLLELAPDAPKARIKNDLRGFDPTQLLFLRKLRTVEVSVDGKKMMVRREDFQDVSEYNGEMRRLTVSDPDSHKEVVTDYTIVRKRILVTHESTKRRGAKDTEVVLAFPVASNCPVIQAQNAYNFLPVRKTSFFFLIQADFILAANREDLDDSHEEWNQMLLRALAQAFTLPALRFQDTPLKFSWIRFLPVDDEPCFALSMLPKLIRENLRKAPLLMTNHEAPVAGLEAVFIPQAFRLEDGNPLIDNATFLHKEYDISDFPQLRWLSATTMSHQKFLSDLKTYIEVESGRQFQEQEAVWHTGLARILSDNQEIGAGQIAELPIIRLEDGRWVATKNSAIAYEMADTNIMDRVPRGLDHIQLVHRSAASNPDRLRLLQKLGVKQFDSRQVCSLIIAQHKRSSKPSYDLSVLISHAVYLFQAQHNLRGFNKSEVPMLWLCTFNGAVERASAMYVDDPNLDDPVSRHLAGGPAASLMLHKEVVEAIRGSKSAEWLQWLIKSLGVSPILRVVNSPGDDITAEFSYFLEKSLPSVSLRYLVKYWRVHFPEDSVPKGVRQAIASTEIEDDSHNKQKLGALSIACKELARVAPKGLPFLSLPGVDDTSRQHLKHFGVGIPDHYHFVRHCINIQKTKRTIKKEVVPLYQLLQKCFARAEIEIIFEFRNKPMIYYPPENKWVLSSECVWEAKRGFATKFILAEHYPDQKHLFHECLGIPNADIDMVLQQITEMNSQLEPDKATISRLEQLLPALSCHLSELSPHEARTKLEGKLKHQHIIPVCRMINGVRETKLMRLDWDFWFYADTKRYFEAFDGTEVWLAAFKYGDWSNMHHLHSVGSKVFKRRERRLSRAAKEIKAGGKGLKLSEDGTRLLSWKGIYLRRIAMQAAHAKPSFNLLLQKTKVLLKLEVWGGASLEARPYVEWLQGNKAKPIYGKNVQCRVTIEPLSDEIGLRICFQDGLLESKKLGGVYYDLAKDIAEFCGDWNHSHLMAQVLHEDDPQQIEELLTKHGVGPCEDERTYGAIAVQLAPARELAESGVLKDDGCLKENSSTTSTLNHNSRATTHVDDSHIKRLRSHRAAINGEAKVGASSVPILQNDARNAIRSSVRKVEVAGVVPTGKFIRNSNMPHAAADNNAYTQRVLRGQVENSLETANTLLEEREVGLQGEYFTYLLLKTILNGSFSYQNWTSELRQFVAQSAPAWQPSAGEEDASDFTFFDKDRVFLNWLLDNNIEVPVILQSRPPTFHIEVKSTTRLCDETFHLSRLQKLKAENLTIPSDSDGSPPTDLFVIFRVYNLSTDPDSKPGLQIYIDPFKLFEEGVLQCEPEGWLVRPAQATN